MTVFVLMAALALVVLVTRRYRLSPIAPAVAYGVVFFALLFLKRVAPISNFAGGVVAGVMTYFLFRWWDEMRSGVGKWAPVFATFITPPFAQSIAERVHGFIRG